MKVAMTSKDELDVFTPMAVLSINLGQENQKQYFIAKVLDSIHIISGDTNDGEGNIVVVPEFCMNVNRLNDTQNDQLYDTLDLMAKGRMVVDSDIEWVAKNLELISEFAPSQTIEYNKIVHPIQSCAHCYEV